MKVNMQTAPNFSALYQASGDYYKAQYKAARAVNASLNLTDQYDMRNRPLINVLESKGWDVLIQPGKGINSVSVSLISDTNVDDEGKINYKEKVYVDEFHKNNTYMLRDAIQEKLKENNGVKNAFYLAVVFMLTMSAAIALLNNHCSGSKADVFKDNTKEMTAKKFDLGKVKFINLVKRMEKK